MVYNRFSNRIISFFVFTSLFLSSCTSLYHWVLIETGNSRKIPKEDSINSNLTLNSNLAYLGNPSFSLLVQDTLHNESSLPFLDQDHGWLSHKNTTLLHKALEIRNSLPLARMQDLKSNDKSVRAKAITETMHEELSRNHRYLSLSPLQQEKIEKGISKNLAGLDNFAGLNHLILGGLALLVVSILFFILPGIGFIGILFDVVAVVLLILGLAELLG